MTSRLQAASEAVHDVLTTTCCVVGGGPAGLMLSLLLARQGIAVTLLEAHHDFERDFRGDTVHPVTLEVLDQLGLADPLLQQPHGKLRKLRFQTPAGLFTLIDIKGLATKFPFVAMLPQARFLDFVAREANRYPSFRLVLGANVQRLVEEGGVIHGVRYRPSPPPLSPGERGRGEGWHEVRAVLTVGADGRFSKLRQLAGVAMIKTAPPMDVLWFRLPRTPADPKDADIGHLGRGLLVILLDRGDEWQVGYVVPKGGYQKVKAAGIALVRRRLLELVPWLAPQLEHLHDWKQVAVLSVESSRARCWHKPGLLLIGDAAHVMSPVGGVGINYAIQDAVEAANLLGPSLKKGRVPRRELAHFQHRRQWVTRLIQAFQAQVQKRVVAPALDPDKAFRMPFIMRLVTYLPLLQRIPAQLILFAIKRVRLKE